MEKQKKLNFLLVNKEIHWKLDGNWKIEDLDGQSIYYFYYNDNELVENSFIFNINDDKSKLPIFMFPTEKMMKEFIIKFKPLIDECKEYLI